MKTKYKYFILIFVTVLACVLIYNFVEENTMVDKTVDILSFQKNVESDIVKDNNYSIDNPKVILNPYEISPLTALVVFKTNDLASATVTVKGKGGDEDISNVFVPSKEHYITIYGLYPDCENTVIISCSGEKKVLKIKTSALDDNIKNAETFESNTGDFYFTTSIDGYPIAYDKNGTVRWYLNKKYTFDFTRLSNGYILLGNSSLIKDPYYSSGLVEMDLLGKVYYEYNVPGGYHHDVFEKTDGNLLLLSNDFSNKTKEDLIVEVDRNTGGIVKEFNLSKLFKGNKGDWIGLNSILYNASSNSILAASYKKDMIVNIDYNSGEINWIIGDNIDSKYKKYALEGSNEIEFPIKPEAITLIDGNNFAYINQKNDENHLIIYDVNTAERTFEEASNTNLGPSEGSSNLVYDDGYFLVVQGNKIKKLKDDELSLVMKVNSNLYSAKATKMYAGDIYMINDGVRLGDTGITPTVKDPFIIFYHKDKSIFKKYNLSFNVDANRLAVTGTFSKNDDVQIILDNVLSKKTYQVTAGSSKKSRTTTYINKKGVYGKYYIYLKINGKIYKLSKYVVMS